MIPFEKLKLQDKARFDAVLMEADCQSCEYSFANLFLWGRKSVAEQGGCLLVESKFDRRQVYLFPMGRGDVQQALEAIIHDAAMRRIDCSIAALTEADCRLVEDLYPGKFVFHCDRDSYDYVYAIEDLAELKGRKFQKKRNHLNRFREAHPEARIVPLSESNRVAAFCLAKQWYEAKCAHDPDHDHHLEYEALHRAFAFYAQLGMEGVVLEEKGALLAFAMGSRLNHDTFDIHFEKALDIDGAYAAVNQGFAAYLREKYPEVVWLNREDDMGLEGLRKAKLSYNPHHLVEKCWARLREDADEI